MRITLLDGFRGFFLLFMMVSHLDTLLDTQLGRLTHHRLGWVEDAQGFVFISGFVVALVYGAIYRRKGEAVMRQRIWARIGTIYTHYAAVIFILLGAAIVLGAAGDARLADMAVGKFYAEPVVFTLASLLMLTGTLNTGILPMYIVFLAVTPLVFRALSRGYAITLLTISVGFWVFAQTGVLHEFTDYAETFFAAAGHPIGLGISFSVFGWQLVFFSGFYFGYLSDRDELNLSMFDSRDVRSAALVGLVFFVLLAILDRIVEGNLLGMDFRNAMRSIADRDSFSAIYAGAFFLDLFLIAWLLVAGPRSAYAVVRWLSRMFNKVFTLPPLVFLGQHSLHVFSAHLLVVAAMDIVFAGTTPGPLVGNILILLSPLPLFATAWGHAQYVRWSRTRSSRSQPRSA